MSPDPTEPTVRETPDERAGTGSRARCQLPIALPIAMVIGLFAAAGCTSLANWSPCGDSEVNQRIAKRPLRKVSRSIELETRFVQIEFDPCDPDHLQSVWQWVDETIVPVASRERLQKNGLRIGKAVQPERLVTRLESLAKGMSDDEVERFLASAEVASHQNEGGKTIPMRIGKRYELPVRMPMTGTHVVIVHDEPQPVGRTLLEPQFLFAITPQPTASVDQIQLRFRPEVQHGDMRQDWVQGDAALRIDLRRQSWSLDDLDFQLDGSEGDLFVISETARRKGLGMQMLGGKNVDQMEQQTVLLLRIANVPKPSDQL